MKLKCDLVFTQAGGREIAVPTGNDLISPENIIFVNEVASFILKCLKDDISRGELLTRLVARYDAKSEVIEMAMSDFLKKLDQLGLITIDHDEC